MRLILRCTGGFTGRAGAQTRTVELTQLHPNEAMQVEQLVHSSNFFTLPTELLKTAPQSWDLQYDLEVQEGQQTHCVRYNLEQAPASLKSLTEKISDEVDPD